MTGPIQSTQTANGFNLDMGFELLDWEPGRTRTRVLITPRQLNSQGIVHGGVYCAFLDFTAGACGVCPDEAETPDTCMTLSLTTNFLASAREGELFGTARRTGGGHKLFYAEALIEDAEGRAIASAMGTFKYGPRTGG
jgi:uncharacterized protein (TIGR00369 family)